MADDAGEVDRRLDTGVAAAHHRNGLALEQRSIAVRAIRHAIAAVFLLARHAQLAPARAGGEDHAAALEHRAIGQDDFRIVARFGRRDELVGALQVHDIDVVLIHVLFQRRHQLGPFRCLDRDEVLDRQGVRHLAAETFGHDAGAEALACGIDRRRRAARATADDEDVERIARCDLLRFALRRPGVDLGEDLLERHASGAENLAVERDSGHRHDVVGLDLVAEDAAVDHRMADARVEDGHEVERLHHVRAVVAGQRDVGDKVHVGVERADRLDVFRIHLGRIAARLQQRQHQRGEFMPHRQAGETHAHVGAGAADRERGDALALGVVGHARHHDVGQRRDLVHQRAHFSRFGAVIQISDQFNLLINTLKQGLELGFHVLVQHGYSLNLVNSGPSIKSLLDRQQRPMQQCRQRTAGVPAWAARRRRAEARRGAPDSSTMLRSCRRDRARGRGSLRLLSTWPGTLRSGWPPRIAPP